MSNSLEESYGFVTVQRVFHMADGEVIFTPAEVLRVNTSQPLVFQKFVQQTLEDFVANNHPTHHWSVLCDDNTDSAQAYLTNHIVKISLDVLDGLEHFLPEEEFLNG